MYVHWTHCCANCGWKRAKLFLRYSQKFTFTHIHKHAHHIHAVSHIHICYNNENQFSELKCGKISTAEFIDVFFSFSLFFVFSLFFCIRRHPHGRLASCVLSHCGAAILLSFALSPILCLPTYFVFRINEKYVLTDNHTKVPIYHVNTKEDTTLYR